MVRSLLKFHSLDETHTSPDNYYPYAGIGSRSTPKEILNLMIEIADHLKKTYTLRSGHAQGADQAFEYGAQEKAEVYLPWASFNHDDPLYASCWLENPSDEAFEIAEKHHPRWKYLTRGSKQLHARNAHQILGMKLDSPVCFIVCFTPDGLGSGGTGQALRIANSYEYEDVPIVVYDLFYKENRDFWIAGMNEK